MMNNVENGNSVEAGLVISEQEQTKLTIDELSAQIKRMTDYVQQHRQSNTAAIHKTLKATIRYRDSLAASINHQV